MFQSIKMTTYPSLFLSHGAPTLAIEPSPAQNYLKTTGRSIEKPSAIILISAHHIAHGVAVTSDPQPDTIYDFHGFPDALYNMTYTAPGSPDLADDIVSKLISQGFPARTQSHRGLDHGAWVPLSLMFPQANIPVVQVSIDMSKSPAWHYALGRALAPFRDQGALIIGSGSTTHNLKEFFHSDYEMESPSPDWVDAFSEWIAERIAAGDLEAILNAVERGPHGHRNHPTMDHILPLFVALGAGGENADSARLHKSTTYGVLAMDVYGFGSAKILNGLTD